MNYFSDYLQTLGNDFEIAATEFDLIIVKENSELILMGMMEQLKALEKPLKEGISKGGIFRIHDDRWMELLYFKNRFISFILLFSTYFEFEFSIIFIFIGFSNKSLQGLYDKV